ncbi:hypothetical protein ACHAWO_011283 [Cyclotella atomus]|uniref:SGNH hydrolase-type esterase domain-containing protein n=1 Tax=Cyclotella atomus TaxID=382360 RepID=A0ABD3MVU0_9STRA
MPKQQRCSTRRRRVLISAELVVLAALHSMNQMIFDDNFAESRMINANAQRSFLAVQHETIPLNRDRGPINAADVESITHVPDTATILVQLKRNRTSCAEPQLIGRLSGIHLSKVKWSYEELTHHDVIVGHYSVPAPGPYFIEIIVTMCQRLDINTDAKNACLTRQKTLLLLGFGTTTFTSLRNHKLQPLHTRYQPQGCRHPKTHMTNRCRIPTNTARFDPYQFQFYNPFNLTQELESKEATVLCYVGASHSGVLMQFSRIILKRMEIQSNNITVLQKDYRYVANLTEDAMVDVKESCDKAVIGIGQWDASRYGGDPTSFVEFRRLLREAMRVFVMPLLDARVDVYFRNMHYQPLGDLITACPPSDWRNPNTVDMYNDITSELCREFGLRFIDSTDITGIMWDRQDDWGHFKDVSGHTEALYLLHHVLSR